MENKIYKYLFTTFLVAFPFTLFAKVGPAFSSLVSTDHTITGRVSDTNQVGLPGVTIKVQGTKLGTVTDLNGHYSIAVPNGQAVLEFSFVGYETKTISVNGRSNIDVTMQESSAKVGEVVITAFGTEQTKESVVGAISTVRPDDLKIPSSNLTAAFAGKLPGVIAFQRSGEPGQNNAQFFIRGVSSFSTSGKKDPLILVDGIEMTADELARLNVDDIASFSIMKDASAAALYGARGANGVILITTKEGKVDKLDISLRVEQSTSFNSELVQLADPITYMELHNMAVRTRDPMVPLPYSLSKIRNTKLGTDPVLYPSVDWYNYMIAKSAPSRRANLNITGGGKRYSISSRRIIRMTKVYLKKAATTFLITTLT